MLFRSYLMLNKPEGVVSAAQDKRDTTVVDLVKDCLLYTSSALADDQLINAMVDLRIHMVGAAGQHNNVAVLRAGAGNDLSLIHIYSTLHQNMQVYLCSSTVPKSAAFRAGKRRWYLGLLQGFRCV